MHRTLNVIGVLLGLLGFALVFVAKDLSWTGPAAGADQSFNLSPGALHSLVGLVLLGPGGLFQCMVWC